MAETYSRPSLLPENYFRGLKEENLNIEKGKVWHSIMEGCYKKEISPFYFTKFILGDLLYAGFPEKYRYDKLMYKIDQLLLSNDHVGLMLPRGHGKSLKISIIEPIRRGFLFESHLSLLEGSSQDQVNEEVMAPIKRIIFSNEALMSKLPEKKNRKLTENYIAYNRGYIIGRGFGSAIRGKHLNYIAVDDILRQDNKLSDRQIEAFMFEELEPMITVRHGQIVLVGTPKHPADIMHNIMEKSDNPESSWVFQRYPAVLSFEKKQVLCPARFTFAQLMQKRIDQGVWRFSKEYMCEFMSDATALFDTNSISEAIKSGRDYSYLNYGEKGKIYYMGVDLARSGSVSADYSVYTVLEYDEKTRIKIPVHITRWKGRKTSIQVDKIAEISTKFNNCIVLVEKNNIGQEFIDDLTDRYNVSVESITTGVSNTNYSVRKEDLVRFLISEFQHEKVILPYKTEKDRDITDELVNELMSMQVTLTPAGNEKFEGKPHDDQVISLCLANKATHGIASAFGLSKTRNNNTYLTDRYNESKNFKHETDLVKRIASGLIK